MSDGQFIAVDFDIIDKPKFRKVMTETKGAYMLYLFLRRHVIRAPMKTEILNEVYNKYFINGKLAATFSMRKLEGNLFISTKTLKSALDGLVKEGYIKIEKLETKMGTGFTERQNVYIMGTWKTYMDDDGIEKRSERFFMEEKLRNPLDDMLD